jgi:drug/metabolite transporter (DMT)-like permease
MSPQTKGLIGAIVTALSWSILAIGLKYILFYTTAGNIAWIRMLVAAISLGTYFALRAPEKFAIFMTLPLSAVIAGLCLSANYFGFMKGIELSSATNTQIMIQMGPLTLLLIGVFFFKETPNRYQAIGFVSAIVGFAFFYWDQFQLTLSSGTSLLAGNLWIAMAAFTWAAFATINKVLSKKWDPQQVNFVIFLVSSFALLPMADLSALPGLEFTPWTLLLFFGLNTVLAYGALGYALKHAPASQVSVIISANPLLTLLILAVMSRFSEMIASTEKIDPLGYVGAGLVVIGIVLASSKKKSAQAPPGVEAGPAEV